MLASKENAKDLNVLRNLIETGQVSPAIDTVYALSDAAAAIRHVQEGRAKGKVVIAV
jgi:NADPH:quinone reductase-like Zn-dependent oxidoreductase